MSHELTVTLAWLLVAIPAVSAAILLLGGKATNAWGHLLGTAASLASFVCGVLLFFQMQGLPDEERSETIKLFEWFSVGSVHVDVTLLVDQLSILFVLLITGVGSLIHIYSIGYMAHDPRRRRFFGYLNLFIASMLLLVLAADYLLVFVGWEGVGLASYLLIGFWQHKHSAATAAKKAFVVNRVGDIGLSLAVMSMWALFGSSAFTTVNAGAEGMSSTWATLVGLMLLLAACGKSAQVPLQSWLLDAMEGPTPVSALIHAATMVTAGVYLVTRSHAIFEHTEVASTAVVIVGTVTVLAGAIIGCAKDDIKKALAGSTMSQIGYMMLAAGLGPAGLRVRDLPPDHARLLQGQHVPRRRLGDARHERRREHAPLRRPADVDEDHLRDLPDGLPGDHRVPGLRRLLEQGQDHRGRVRGQLRDRVVRPARRPVSPRST